MASPGGWGQPRFPPSRAPYRYWGRTPPPERSRSRSRRPHPTERGNWRGNQLKTLQHNIRVLRKTLDEKETDYQHEARLYDERYGDRTGRLHKSQTALIGVYENLRDRETN